MGEMRLQDCPNWGGEVASGERAANADTGDTRLPWSGAALGTTDLPFVTSRSEPKLLALVGPHNAGKTTLLGSWYQLIGRSGSVGSALFAGSFSLQGWEAVAHSLRWDGGAPKFPTHTSSGAGRTPGLLHLALREGDQQPTDLLFADAPGEWFHRWAVEAAAPDAEGARWLMERASAFLVVADCEALSGPERGEARSKLLQLIRRLGTVTGTRSTALVWAKADVGVPSGMRDTIVEATGRALPSAVQFRTSVHDFEVDGVAYEAAKSMLDLLSWCVAPTPRGFTLTRATVRTDDPFFYIGTTA